MVILGYAVVAYATFLASIVWAIIFMTGPVDGPAQHAPAVALAIDGVLLLAFAAQHTVMARASFKRLIPAKIERSTFVLASSLLLIATFAWWQPAPTQLWHVGTPWSAPIWLLYAVGWAVAIGSTYMIDHNDLFGLKQAVSRVRKQGYRPPEFRERWLYAWCRHPMMLGLLITFWATPRMTAGHLFFALASSGYIAIGLRFEERDLRRQLGADYRDYATRVPMLIPGLRLSRPVGSSVAGHRR